MRLWTPVARRVPPLTISRLPPGAMEAVPLSMPPLETAYSYVIAKLGPIMARASMARCARRSALRAPRNRASRREARPLTPPRMISFPRSAR